jgi:hypothetical protein
MNAERLFALLLWAYPRSFRQEYGDAMLATFRELRTAPGHPKRGRWPFIVGDVFRAAATLWWDECRRSFVLRWLTTCAIGLLSTALVANLMASFVSYLYHPYLEGFRLSALAYGALLGLILGGTTAISQWWLLPRHDARTWALASAVGLLVAVLLCGTVINRTVMGMNPIAEEPMHEALRIWLSALDQPDAFEVALEFGMMTVSAAVFGSATRWQMERRHAC